MSEEIAELKVMVSHIEKTLEDIIPKIDKHELACETHAPMAQQAHDATRELSIFMSNQDQSLKSLIARNDKKDEADAIFQKNVYKKFDELGTVNNLRDIADAEKRGAEKALEKVRDKRDTKINNIIGTLFLLLIGFGTWVVLAIIDLKVDDAKHDTINKAIKHNHSTKVKKSKDSK